MGNYKAYAAKKQQIRDARLKEYMNQQREIKHQQAVIEKLRSFNREKSIKRAESREKMLDRITPVEKPVESVREMHFSLEPSCISGSDVLTCLLYTSSPHRSVHEVSETLHESLPLHRSFPL